MIRVNPNDPGGIVWLASYPKSGNTWLRVFLYHTARIMRGLPLEGNDLHQLDRSSFYEARAVRLFEEFLGKPFASATRQEIIPIRPRVHALIAKRTPQPIHVKTHMAAVNIMGTPTINFDVTCGAIYVVRNPLDVVFSLADHDGNTIDNAITVMCKPSLYTAQTDKIYEPWGSWSENVSSWTAANNETVLAIRYEDMQANPIKAFRSVTDHLGMNPTPEQLVEAIELSDFKRLSALEDENGFREVSPKADRFFRVGRVGQWPDKLSAEQIRRIVASHHRQMSRFGYLTGELRDYIPEGPRP
jgi:hypothetical protein